MGVIIGRICSCPIRCLGRIQGPLRCFWHKALVRIVYDHISHLTNSHLTITGPVAAGNIILLRMPHVRLRYPILLPVHVRRNLEGVRFHWSGRANETRLTLGLHLCRSPHGVGPVFGYCWWLRRRGALS